MDRYQQLLIDGVVGFMIFASAGEEPAAQAKPGESRRPSSLTASQKSHTPPQAPSPPTFVTSRWMSCTAYPTSARWVRSKPLAAVVPGAWPIRELETGLWRIHGIEITAGLRKEIITQRPSGSAKSWRSVSPEKGPQRH